MTSFRIDDIRQTTFTKVGLKKALIDGLTGPTKYIPDIMLYDDTGLQLYEIFARLEEYYLRTAEVDIFENQIDQIIEYIPDGSAVIELGSGSMQKSQLIIKALERKKKDITYYALDLMEDELRKSLEWLSSLGEFQNVKIVGLWGTYDDGRDFAAKLPKNVPKTIVWLGSSVGNRAREESASFIKTFQAVALNPGDLFYIGIDRRKNADKVILAYRYITDFVKNGLDHANVLFGQPLIDRNDFEYVLQYNDDVGRIEIYHKVKNDLTLEYTSDENAKMEIKLKKDELIRGLYAYKYSKAEMLTLFHDGMLSFGESWPDSKSQYDFNLVYKPPFHFARNFESQESAPTIEEWEELWKSSDTVMMTMVSPKFIHERPIESKHPLIFYVGHIPAFLDINLARYFKEKCTEPQNFADIFGRDMDHPDDPDRWPDLNSIISFRDRVRQRLNTVYNTYKEKPMPRSLSNVLWMSFEHQAMHLETFLYMLVQFKHTNPPKGVVAPLWKPSSSSVPKSELITIPTQTITLENDDNEYADDNKRPSREVTVQSFKIQSRPVTNGEYLAFMKATTSKEYPSSWTPVDSSYKVRTVFGPVDMNVAENWPVMLSQEQASRYAVWAKMRLPTEEELKSFLDSYASHPDIESNIGFSHWHPIDVPHDKNAVQGLGSGWEWTSTVRNERPGSDKSDGKHAVILGGSWATHPRMIRRSSRNWYRCGHPYVFCSFRLCL